MALALDALSTEEQITLLYVAYFGRAPDPDGLNHWVDNVNNGLSLLAVAGSFAQQAEAIAEYPFLDGFINSQSLREDFINDIYQNLFGRPADPAGLAYWEAALEHFQSTLAGDALALAIGQFVVTVALGAQGTDAEAVLAKVEVAHYITEQLVIEDVPFNATIAEESKDLIADTTAANVEPQKAAVDALLDTINASIDYTSTIGETLQGTDGNDTFSGVIDQRGGSNTLDPSDFADGSEGNDKIVVHVLDESNADILIEAEGVEILQSVSLEDDADFNLINFLGIEEIRLVGSELANFFNVTNVVDLAIVDVDEFDTVEIDLAATLGEPTDTVVNLELENAFFDLSYEDGVGSEGDFVTQYNMQVTGDAEIGLDDLEFLTKAQIEGPGNLFLFPNDDAPVLSLIDAGNLDGFLFTSLFFEVDAEIIAAQGDNVLFLITQPGLDLAVTSFGGNDQVFIEEDDGTNAIVVSLGAGDDILATSSLGDDYVLDGGDGADVLELVHDAIDSNALLSLPSITGFETVFLTSFLSDVADIVLSVAGFPPDVTTIGFDDDPQVNVTIDDIAIGTAIAIQDGDTGDGGGDWINDLTLGVNQTADATLNLVIKADGNGFDAFDPGTFTLEDVVHLNVEVSEQIDVFIDTIVADDLETMTVTSGDDFGDVEFRLDGAGGLGGLILLDLSGLDFDTLLEVDLDAGADGATVKVGDYADGSALQLTDLGATDTVVFTDRVDGDNVDILDFQTDGGLDDDVIDVTDLGLAAGELSVLDDGTDIFIDIAATDGGTMTIRLVGAGGIGEDQFGALHLVGEP
jgi:hypothetical protein